MFCNKVSYVSKNEKNEERPLRLPKLAEGTKGGSVEDVRW
jgi:hypothetical protein